MSRFADLVIKQDRTGDEDRELHRLAQNLEFTTNDLGTVIGPSGTVARLRAGSVVLDNAGMHTYLGGVETGRVEADGDFLLGTNIAAAATTSFAVFTNAQTYNSESIGAGDLLMGDNSSSKANILWDKSTGQLLFRSGTTTQGYIDTDGGATFGSGKVVLDADGISIVADLSIATQNAIRWLISGSAVSWGRLGTYYGGSSPNRAGLVELAAESEGTGTAQIALKTRGSDNYYSYFILAGGEAGIDRNHNSAGVQNVFRFECSDDGGSAAGEGGRVYFTLNDDGGNQTHYMAAVDFVWDDPSDGSEDGRLIFHTMIGGSGQQEHLMMDSKGSVFNDASLDLDTRIETNNFPYAVNVDAGTDSITIALDVRGASGTAYPAVGINTPQPQHLFEIHKTAWDQTFDNEIADFDAVSPVWDGEVDAVGDFDAETDADGDLNDHADAAHDGAVGLEITFDDANNAYGTINMDAVNQTSAVASLWFHPNDVSPDNGTNVGLIRGNPGAGNPSFQVLLYKQVDGYRIRPQHIDDSGFNGVTQYAILTQWNHLAAFWQASSAPGADDGFYHVYLNDALLVSFTGIDNDTKDIDTVLIGMFTTTSTGFGGSYYIDTIKIDPIGAPFASKLAVKNGTYGLAVPVMDGTERYTEFTEPTSETISTGEKWFDPNTITMATNDAYDFMYSPGEWAVSCVKSATAYTIKLTVDKDSGTSVTSAYEITDAFHLIRAVVASSTGAGADDGYGHLYSDGVLLEALTGIDNDTKSVGEVRYGIRGADAGTYGIFYMDDCKWRSGSGLAITTDGDLLFKGTSGLAYGSMYTNTDIAVTATAGVWVEMDAAQAWTTGKVHNCTFADPKITVTNAGTYQISYALTLASSIANKHVETGIMIDSTVTDGPAHGAAGVQNVGRSHAELLNIEKTASCHAFVQLAAGKTVSLAVRNTDSLNPTVTASHGTITIMQIAGASA